jgi:hypothetical protein
MLDPFSVDYGEIRGMLSAFAELLFQGTPDIHFSFDFEYLQKLETVQATLEAYTHKWAETVTLVPLASWKETLQKALETWLFGNLLLPEFSKPYKHSVIEHIIDKIEHLVRPTAVWRVDIKPKGFYELEWEDFSLENEKAVFLLHLGFSD